MFICAVICEELMQAQALEELYLQGYSPWYVGISSPYQRTGKDKARTNSTHVGLLIPLGHYGQCRAV